MTTPNQRATMGETQESSHIWQLQSDIAHIKERMVTVEKGVSNFRDFQASMRDFVVRHDTREQMREELDKRRATIHYALLGGLISLIVGLSIWFVTWVMTGKHMVSEGHTAQVMQQDAAAHYTER